MDHENALDRIGIGGVGGAGKDQANKGAKPINTLTSEAADQA
jgi:hypothetical protein